MIVDSLANLDFYGPLNGRFAKALAYLRGVDLKALPEGKYEIDAEEVYMMISERDLKKKADAAMDLIRMKYGKDTVKRSTFAGSEEKAYEGGKLKINNRIL